MKFTNQPLTPAMAFRQAVDRIGSQAATGSLLGITQPAISKILSAGKPCPHENQGVIKVEKATGISRFVLRPDLYPRESITTAGHGASMERAR